MKNATLSVRWVLVLGTALWVAPAVAHAQAGDTGDDATDAGAADGADGDDAAGDDAAGDDGSGDDGSGDDGAGQDAAAAGTGDIEVDDGHDEIPPPDGLEPAPEPAQSPEPLESQTAAESAPSSSGLASPEGQDDAEADADADAAEAEDAEDAEEEAPAEEPVPWRNSFFSWTNQVTFNSFLRDAQLSYDPNYSQNFSLNPRWYLAPTTFLWASASLSLELTDTEGTALNREPMIGDTLVDLRHMIPWEGFIFIPAARIGLPTSKISIAAQRYLQTGLTLTAVRPISEIGLTVAGLFSYRRWWAGSNVVQVGEPQPDNCPPPPPPTAGSGDSAPTINTATCDQLGTSTSARDILLYGLSITWAPPGLQELNVSLQAFFFTTYGYELAPAYVQVDTREELLRIDDGSPSHWNNFTYFALSVGYQFTSWMNWSIGIQNSGVVASVYNPDGSVRNPLFTPDTQVFVSGTFQIDDIWSQITGNSEDDLTPEERLRRRQGLASGPSAGGAF